MKSKDKTITIKESKLNKMKHLYYTVGYILGVASTMFLLSDYMMLFTGWGVGFKFNN